MHVPYFADFAALPKQERSMLWQMYTNETLRSRIVNWKECALYASAIFRGFMDREAGDPRFAGLVEDLKQASPLFEEQWERYEVRKKSGLMIRFMNTDFTVQPLR
ncbi:hypothetical protein LJK88_03270 [Paenibacillus sp. P26]|nr:hypothetical protein LJK88_03270 [Paenibacillus sp. P26]UUZ90860.1 hypothetical protein LJK87_34225 [Paenibacillus sp. P25]